MSNIEVGEYIRTKDGYIGKIIEIRASRRDCDTYYVTNKTMASGFYEHIVKHSKNIIDLIEVGDYVDGIEIDKIKEDKEGKYLVDLFLDVIRNKDIKSIVTKEQFKSVEYEV